MILIDLPNAPGRPPGPTCHDTSHELHVCPRSAFERLTATTTTYRPSGTTMVAAGGADHSRELIVRLREAAATQTVTASGG
jgi:hypothetical protein